MHYLKSVLLCWSCLPLFAAATDFDYVGLGFENDVFYREDDGYTNGLTINWGYYGRSADAEQELPAWSLPLFQQTYLNDLENRQHAIHYTLGQFLQTSTDIELTELAEDDAPYVGMIAGQVNLSSYNQQVADDVSLTVGMVGPVAGGEYVQKHLHKWIRANKPRGWDGQINNELVFRLEAERKWHHALVQFTNGSELDVVSAINAGVGTLLSDVKVGASLRWGQALAENFQSSSPFLAQRINGLKTNAVGWYVFTNFSTSYVVNDIFIDGNTFEDSHHVDLLHLQAEVSAGIQVNWQHWNVIYKMLYGTDQYKTQRDETRWGNVAITYHF